ncbi:MAG TPA: ABC transporter ATP-binding protein [Polyangiaceae bacterium]|jgi:lipoprotein-releasing system ATP-binding protein|nr:ABC transporter ATP-binding protein [Polyangiaceae bacterium]
MSEPAAANEPLLRLDGVTKSFGDVVVTEVLHGVDLELARGEFAALIGPSGSGKSTLLNLIGLLDRPTSGSIRIAGNDASGADEATLSLLRAETLGFVFQFHHLIGSLSALENLMMPLSIRSGRLRAADRERARAVLADVGLGGRAGARPSELSGGQQQRVAIARALVHEPALVLADEPTGNLDTGTADEIFALLRRFNRERALTFLIVTHDPRLAARCDRIISLVDGRIAGDVQNEAEGVRGSTHG